MARFKKFEWEPNSTQQELSEKVVKDSASVTRIIDLLVKSEFVEREINLNDRRKFNLKITSNGIKILDDTHGIVLQNRKKALEGISENDIKTMNETLKKITNKRLWGNSVILILLPAKLIIISYNYTCTTAGQLLKQLVSWTISSFFCFIKGPNSDYP